MRIVNGTLDRIYFWQDDAATVDSKTAARIQKRKENLARVGVNVDMDTVGKNEITVSLTERQLTDLMMLGEVITVSSTMDIADDRLMRVADIISTAAEKLERFAGALPESDHMFNDKVQVYTPGMGLMLFNRVMLLQDSCSDALQTELDNGWRIIAACPQPDQRRPDYILGRYDPAHADNSGAASSALRG